VNSLVMDKVCVLVKSFPTFFTFILLLLNKHFMTCVQFSV
jgi:hypothetical protein